MENIKFKDCRQCGEVKPITEFRKYYGGRKGTYTICRSCERINSRAKYLERKSEQSTAEIEELEKIHRLYEAQRKLGLRPPRADAGRHTPVTEQLDDLLNNYEKRAEATQVEFNGLANVPEELSKWLYNQLEDDPDYYLDEVYEDLKAKYRPVLKIGEDMLPVYDDTYKDVLEMILDRFNTYEDEWNEE